MASLHHALHVLVAPGRQWRSRLQRGEDEKEVKDENELKEVKELKDEKEVKMRKRQSNRVSVCSNFKAEPLSTITLCEWEVEILEATFGD